MRRQDKGITLIALIITIVVLLILAVVTINAVKDGGIINYAQKSAKDMNEEQIKEKAKIAKMEFKTNTIADKNAKNSIQEFRQKLKETFGVEEKDTNDDNIIEINDKYAIVIKNNKLETEVVEITEELKSGSYILLSYTAKDAKENDQVYLTDIELSITNYNNAEPSSNLSLYVKKDAGKEELLKNSITATETPILVNYRIIRNGKYEFILKTSEGQEVTSEILQVNNIAKSPYILTKEEANKDWVLNLSGTEIIEYKGKAKEVTVPLIIGDTQIEKIGSKSFYQNKNITSVIIPEGIKAIGPTVFDECENLISVTIPSTVTSIGTCAFAECINLKNISVPEGVTFMGEQVFRDCSSLESIVIPKCVTSICIADYARCKSLKTIYIPDSVTSIGNGAFSGCSNLIDITIPDSVTSIGKTAFAYCESLKILEIPSKVTSIGSQAFYGCSGLTTITIPASVNSIGEDAFYRCSGLTNIHFEGTIPTENRPWGASESIITPR